MADKKTPYTHCALHRSIWDITTPHEAADVLTDVYGNAAAVEALLRYHQTITDEFDSEAFWIEVLDILGAPELCDVPMTPRSIADLLLCHCPKPSTLATSYAHEARLEENIAQTRFWLRVLELMDKQ